MRCERGWDVVTCVRECYRRAAVARDRLRPSHHFTLRQSCCIKSIAEPSLRKPRLSLFGSWAWPPSRKHVTYQDPAIAPPAALSLRRRPRPCGRLCFLLGAAAACARPKLGRPPNSEAPVISVTCALRALCINVLLSLPPSPPTQLEPWMAPGWAQCTRIIRSMGYSTAGQREGDWRQRGDMGAAGGQKVQYHRPPRWQNLRNAPDATPPVEGNETSGGGTLGTVRTG